MYDSYVDICIPRVLDQYVAGLTENLVFITR